MTSKEQLRYYLNRTKEDKWYNGLKLEAGVEDKLSDEECISIVDYLINKPKDTESLNCYTWAMARLNFYERKYAPILLVDHIDATPLITMEFALAKPWGTIVKHLKINDGAEEWESIYKVLFGYKNVGCTQPEYSILDDVKGKLMVSQSGEGVAKLVESEEGNYSHFQINGSVHFIYLDLDHTIVCRYEDSYFIRQFLCNGVEWKDELTHDDKVGIVLSWMKSHPYEYTAEGLVKEFERRT